MRGCFRARPSNHCNLARKNIVQPGPSIRTQRPNAIDRSLRFGGTSALSFAQESKGIDPPIEHHSHHEATDGADQEYECGQRPQRVGS